VLRDGDAATSCLAVTRHRKPPLAA
jgi:hypothetical protein